MSMPFFGAVTFSSTRMARDQMSNDQFPNPNEAAIVIRKVSTLPFGSCHFHQKRITLWESVPRSLLRAL
jgi:hypothetical protein